MAAGPLPGRPILPTAPAMIGRLTRAADFERLLGVPVRQRSPHFALHHLAAWPSRPAKAGRGAEANKLSTMSGQLGATPVDEPPVTGCWLGCVVPKRLARRALTRNLLKRQARAAAERHRGSLAAGLWLLRLRSAFAVAEFPAADSAALRAAVRAELDRLFAGCAPQPAKAAP